MIGRIKFYIQKDFKMKLLNRLRELRRELRPEWMVEDVDIHANQHQDTIGIGAATIDDVSRLNIAHYSLENLSVDGTQNQY